MNLMDDAVDIRDGEAIDTDRLETYLKDVIPGLAGPLHVRQFPGGYSNLTYLLSVGGKDMVLRRPPFGTKAKTAHDMKREYTILKALKPVYPYCPEPLAYSEDPEIIGAPFYVMQRIEGIILRKDLPQGLTLTPAMAGELCCRFIDVLAALHRVDVQAAGLADFGRPQGYVRRQVEGWSKRYRAAKTPDVPDYEDIMAWIADAMPSDGAYSGVIHNDYRLDNVVLDPADPLKIIGVLDWEMATLGDPLMDLGNALAYWIQKDDPEDLHGLRLMPTHIDGALTRREILNHYERQTGRDSDKWHFYYCFGLFRLAVIAQQIYYRFYHGQTRDKRFAKLIFAVHILEKAARQVIETGKV